MENSFKYHCYQLMKDVKNQYDFSRQEILIWIYLNIYIYRQISPLPEEYTKQVFLRHLEKDTHFSRYCRKYERIQKESYFQLYHQILYNYADSQLLSVQEMEETYEGILQENLRVKTGSYYTPQPIVEYMVFAAIMNYIDSKIDGDKIFFKDYILGKTNLLSMDLILYVIQLLEEVKIIDIACGGGTFLRQSLYLLYSLKKTLYKLIGKRFHPTVVLHQILQNNLYGVELQEETSVLCKLLLLIEAEKLRESFYYDGDLHVFHHDALTMDFEKILGQKEPFHIVLGNPPYIGERGNKGLFQEIRQKDFGEKYYERNMDYFYFFIYKAFEILKKDGILCYITTNYFVTADGAQKLRNFIRNNFHFKEIINFNTVNLFTEARGQHNVIFQLEKKHSQKSVTLINFLSDNIEPKKIFEILVQRIPTKTIEVAEIPQEKLFDGKGHILIQSFASEAEILEKIERKSNYSLEDLCYVNQGIVSGADRLTAAWAKELGIREAVGSGIFVLKKEELEKLKLDKDHIKMYVKEFYKNSHIKRYCTLKNQDLYLLYIHDHNLMDLNQVDGLKEHFIKYKAILLNRREVKKGMRKWYALQWPRKLSIFEEEKIVVPQRAYENTFAYVNEPWYASADVYYITAKSQEISLYYLLGILNSSLMYYWLFYRGKRKGEYLELYATPLKGLPIFYSSSLKIIKVMENLVEDIIKNIDNKDIVIEKQRAIDQIVFKLYGLTKKEENKIINFVKNRRK